MLHMVNSFPNVRWVLIRCRIGLPVFFMVHLLYLPGPDTFYRRREGSYNDCYCSVWHPHWNNTPRYNRLIINLPGLPHTLGRLVPCGNKLRPGNICDRNSHEGIGQKKEYMVRIWEHQRPIRSSFTQIFGDVAYPNAQFLWGKLDYQRMPDSFVFRSFDSREQVFEHFRNLDPPMNDSLTNAFRDTLPDGKKRMIKITQLTKFDQLEGVLITYDYTAY